MKMGELKSIISNVPDDWDLEILYGHSQLDVTSHSKARYGKALTLTCEEMRDLSDQEKHEG
jgi:hypothetical protein